MWFATKGFSSGLVVYRILMWLHMQECHRRPLEVTIPETVETINDMVLAHRTLEVRVIERSPVYEKVVLEIGSPLVTIDPKRNSLTASKECFALFNNKPDQFLRLFITFNEIHKKEQSKQ